MTYQHSTNNYARAALESECRDLATTATGRNDRLVRSSFSIGQFVRAGQIDQHEAEQRLLAAATANGYVGKDGASAAKATIKSGLDAGMKEPREVPAKGLGRSFGPATIATFRPDPAQNVAGLASVAGSKPIRRPVVAPNDPGDPVIPEWTPPGPDGNPKFVPDVQVPPGGRMHLYRRHDVPVRAKTKDHKGNWLSLYRVRRPTDGCEGWQAKKPVGYQAVPYIGPAGSPDPLDPERLEQTLFCPEGEKDVDSLVRLGLPAFTFGGASDVPNGCEILVRGRDVVILGDNDESGHRRVRKLAELFSTTASRVRVLGFSELKQKGDVTDWLDVHGWNRDNLLRVVDERAEVVSRVPPAQVSAPGATLANSEEPLPLFPDLPPAEPFPVHALGPLASVVRGISHKVQVPAATAAQSVLATAALAAQAHADVVLPYGQRRPLSLYFVTVAASGDRKSTADNEALWPIRRRETVLKEEHKSELAHWKIVHAAWSAEKRKIEAKGDLDFDGRRNALRLLGPEPLTPLQPFLTAPDPTVEGLAKAWVSAPASLGIFTAEGGQMIGGHGMSPEHRLKTAASFSELWDGRPIKRIRALDGVSVLGGRRLAMHLMVQPEAAAQFLADSVVRDQGFLSRLLVAAPDSIAGTRFYREASPEDDAAIRAYGDRILSLLEASWPLVDGCSNELAPRPLPLSREAADLWRTFHDHVERQCGRGGTLAPIRDVAAKAAEQAVRLAGVLSIFGDLGADEITATTMGSALLIMDWYVVEALRLQQTARTDPRLVRAQTLLEWLQARDEEPVPFRSILQFGPSVLRTKAVPEEAISILLAHGWVAIASERPRQFSVVRGR